MGRREEAVELLRQGNSPSKIASLMGVSYQTVMGYLYQRIGEREIAHYQVMLSMDRESRETIEQLLERGVVDLPELLKKANDSGCYLGYDETIEYLVLRDSALADMYEMLRKIETHLHRSIRRILIKQHGRDNWWREGIPVNIRKQLAALREEDAEPAPEPYNYTTLIHLKEIYEKNWTLLSSELPPEIQAKKPRFLSDLTRLNQIRNVVMHPVKGIRLCDDDFLFVRSFKDSLGITF